MHGVGEDHSFFDYQLAEFRGSRQVIAFDQRGCGGSADAPGGNYDLDTRVGDLAKLSDALRLERLVVVGHGTGGQVVARYAVRNPDRVLGLVLMNPVSGNAEAARIAGVPEPDFRLAIEGWLTTLLDGASPEAREQVLASVQLARIPAMRAMLTDAASHDLPESLAAYPGPVLILAAPDESVPGPLRPGIEVRRLVSSSHWSTMDAPDEVNAALREFLRPVDAAAGRQRRSR
jgi:microsomal epoxide hydrolase